MWHVAFCCIVAHSGAGVNIEYTYHVTNLFWGLETPSHPVIQASAISELEFDVRSSSGRRIDLTLYLMFFSWVAVSLFFGVPFRMHSEPVLQAQCVCSTSMRIKLAFRWSRSCWKWKPAVV